MPTTTEAAPRASLRFIGNATVLIRCGGLTLMTDPNFVRAGRRVPIGYGLHARRRIDPAIPFEALPTVDAVVLSHYHGDHFDPDVEARLARTMPIITTPQAAGILERRGFRAALGLDTWEHVDRRSAGGRVRVTATPGRHAPAPIHRLLPSVMGSVIEGYAGANDVEPAVRLYVSGDTILFAGLREITARFPGLDVALIHLGATRVLGMTVTLDETDGARLVDQLAPRLSIPIHIDDYDRFRTTAEGFVRAVERLPRPHPVRILARGETFRP